MPAMPYAARYYNILGFLPEGSNLCSNFELKITITRSLRSKVLCFEETRKENTK
jgi:hypothetical protein